MFVVVVDVLYLLRLKKKMFSFSLRNASHKLFFMRFSQNLNNGNALCHTFISAYSLSIKFLTKKYHEKFKKNEKRNELTQQLRVKTDSIDRMKISKS